MSNWVMEARRACINIIPLTVIVFVANRDRLDGDLSKDKLLATLNLMKNSKSLRTNDLPCEFFKSMWDTIGDDLCCMPKRPSPQVP